MRDSHWAAAQAQKSTEDRNGQEKRRQSRNFLAHQVKWTKAMLFKSARREDIWRMLPPLGPAMCQGHSQQQGQGQHQASLFCKRETEIWGFISPNRTNSTFHMLEENSYTLECNVRKPTHYWGAWWLKQRQTLRNYMKRKENSTMQK